MKKPVLVCILLVLTTLFCSAEVKKADLAGKWYAASDDTLGAELSSYLEKAAPLSINGEIIAIISPHAGFQYSGPIAAYGFKAIKEKNIGTIVIVGFSHRRTYDAIALLDEDGFETPLGIVEIDKGITAELIKSSPKIYNYPIAFSGENSLEMQIPFLQAALRDFKVVLIAIGEQSLVNCRILGNALYEVLKEKENFLIIASTDMSHYLPYDAANALDQKTTSLIEEFDPDKLYRESLEEGHRLMCGYGALSATMIAAKLLGANSVEILKYANSGDTAGDKNRVVGYLSAAMARSEIPAWPAGRQNSKEGDINMLSKEQRAKMLKLARDSIVFYLKEGKRLDVAEDDRLLNKEMGAFVTLHKHGKLRGCIGNMVGRGPFYLTVRDMAIEAAVGDPRFSKVSSGEMGDIDIEISALSLLEKIEDPEKIIMGTHGVIVRKGPISGVYLPQVATETGWSREEFMNSLCGQKAGMAPDAWKRGECDIYIFTAEVFGEKE